MGDDATQKPPQISLTITDHDEKVDENTETMFTCEICIEPTTNITTITNCTHPHCTDCIVKYIRARLENDHKAQIKCPSPGCTQVLDPTPLVGPDLFVRWCDVLCESSLSGLATCHCPKAGCGELVVSECGGSARWRCPRCKSDFCFACKRDWHEGSRCGDDDVAVFVRLAKRKRWKRCPNCRCYVELNGGCRAVNCRCGICFCYGCGRKWLSCACLDKGTFWSRCCLITVKVVIFAAILSVVPLALIIIYF